jgi:hypothetical protein
MARLPLITQRRDIDVRVVHGQSIFELYQQIQILLQRETPSLAHFFAEPIVNVLRGEVAWDTRVPGVPRCASDLPPDEWLLISERLRQKSESVKQLIGKLEKAGRGNYAGTEALRGMLITLDVRQSLFLVNDELVLAQWGCYRFGTDARNADLFEQIQRQPKFSAIASPPPESKPLDPTGPPEPPEPLPPPRQEAAPEPAPKIEFIASPPPLAPEAPVVEPVVEPLHLAEKSASHFWRWLLLLLLLLLLLVGIFWKYWQGNSAGPEAAYRLEIADLWKRVDQKARECGLLPSTPNAGVSAQQSPVTNEEIRGRQLENSISPGGKVNVSLAWNDRADLDLIVKQPDGQVVSFKPCLSSNCGRLDVDANYCDPRLACTNLKERPLENISWGTQMSPGRYVISVGLYSLNSPAAEIRPVSFTVQLMKDGQPTSYQGVISSEEMICTDRCKAMPRRIAEFSIE